MGANELLRVENLKKYYPIKGGFLGRTVNYVKAVDDISFAVNEGETVSLVGESGCGKSTAGRAILHLEKPTAGEVIFEDVNLTSLKRSELRKVRKDMQIVFQDPFASLNPRQTVAQVLEEAMYIQNIVPPEGKRERILDLLGKVGLAPYQADRYPHEFSGGQRQRVGIARALTLNPKLIICDEAVSALDVSIRAQILNLLKSLQREFHLTYLFISHDLSVVRHISDRIIVMYLGRIMEIADKNALFDSPRHPYTRALLSAIPVPRPGRKKERIMLTGDVPSAIDPPPGCRFHTRCPFVKDNCRTEVPDLCSANITNDSHQVACHYFEEI
jgi:oligopeptide/dipeptide ABC transporter ATP-binding protein